MFKDFGLFDIIYNKINSCKKDYFIDNLKICVEVFNKELSNTLVCFLPWRVKINETKKLGLIPKNHRVIVYESSNALASPNPKVSKKLQKKIFNDVKKRNLEPFGVLTYSIGTYPGFFVANNFKTTKLISVVPGDKLGACIWDGIATQKVRLVSEKKYKIKSHMIYDKILKGTNAIENISNLPNEIEIHIASYDNYIKTYHGEKLIKNLKKTKKM